MNLSLLSQGSITAVTILSLCSTVNTFIFQQPSFNNLPITINSQKSTFLSPIYSTLQFEYDINILSPMMTSFEERLIDIPVENEIKEKKSKKKVDQDMIEISNNIVTIRTLEDYRHVLKNNEEKIIVVRFYAEWCKSCKAMAPYFYRLARKRTDILFLGVPITNKNIDLHQGLGVPSAPFGHIYHPDAGLVEELPISKKNWPRFEDSFKTYVAGSCKVDTHCTNPYDDMLDF